MDGAKYLDCFHGTSLKNAFERARDEKAEKGKSRLTDTDQILKGRFWDLVEESLVTNKTFPLSTIYLEVCTYTHFYNNVINNPFKLRWLLTPLRKDNGAQLEAIKRLALKKLRSVMTLPLRNASGNVHVENANALISAMRMLLKTR